jgi:stage V sporulation protein G
MDTNRFANTGTNNDAAKAARELAEKEKLDSVKLDVTIQSNYDTTSNTAAFARVKINDTVSITGVRIVDGENGLFVNLPQSRDPRSGEYHDIVRSHIKGLVDKIKETVLDKYNDSITPDRKQSINDRLNAGRAKMAEYVPQQRTEPAMAKSRPSGLDK